MSREAKVGLLLLVALAVVAFGVFFLGQDSNLFVRKNRYSIRFETVGGLAEGNPVQLNGVNVGQVDRVVLPQDVDDTLLTVWIAIDRHFAARVRTDSLARIKTLGLLGDKYIQLTSGSAGAAPVANGGEISAAQLTDVDELIASGENAVDNVVAVSISLRNILSRMEAGEGILGELTTNNPDNQQARDRILSVLEAAERITQRVERGEGTLGLLLRNEELAASLETTVSRVDAVLTRVEEGQGLLGTLLDDEATSDRFQSTLRQLEGATTELSALATELREGDGLLGRLLADEEYGREVTDDLREMVQNLNKISAKLEGGDGTLGQLINDPELYQALDDIVVGVNESKMLRWLLRNRQKKGLEQRYDEQGGNPNGRP